MTLRPMALVLLVVAGGLVPTAGCLAPPAHRHHAESLHGGTSDGTADHPLPNHPSGLSEEERRLLTQLEQRVDELTQQLGDTERELATARDRMESQQVSLAELESQRAELRDEVAMLSQQVEVLRRAGNSAPQTPLLFERIEPRVISTSAERPALPDAYTRNFEGGFGFDFPEDWYCAVRSSLQFTEYTLSAPDGNADLTIRMWPYPKWASDRQVADELTAWLAQAVTARRDSGLSANARRQPTVEGAEMLVAGQPTIVAEYGYTTELGIPMRHRRALINLVEASSDIYRSFQVDLVYTASEERHVEQVEGVWQQVLRSFWLPGS